MATLQFPVAISQCILSMGIAHLEPQWEFSVKSGNVTLNLTWEHVNTGTLAPGPPPGMKPLQHPLPQYRPDTNMYYKNTARARYVAPRFSRNNSIHRSDQDHQWRTTSQVPYTSTSVESCCTVPNYGHRPNTLVTTGSIDIASEHNNTNNFNKLIANSITFQKSVDEDDDDDGDEDDEEDEDDEDNGEDEEDDNMTQESVPCEVTSNTSHILPSISDKFNTDEKIGDIDSDNISNDDSDQENSQIDTLMNILYTNDHASADDLSKNNLTYETPDISSTMTTLTICEVVSNSTPSCTLPFTEYACSAHSQADAHISAIPSSNSSVSGDDFHQQSSSELDMNETRPITSNNETQNSDEPRFLSENETCETLNSWVEDLTKFLRTDDNFSRLIDSGWKTSSVPNRGCKDDNDVYALGALIGYVVRYSNGAILQSQTRSSKSLKSLLNNVYRHYNIPSDQYIKPNDSL